MDRSKARTLTVAIQKALAKVEEDFGVKIDVNGGRYDGTTFTPRVKVSDVNENGQAETKEFRVLKLRYPELVGNRYTYMGEVIEPVGYNLRAKRYPFLYREVRTGRLYKAGSYLADVLKRQAPEAA